MSPAVQPPRRATADGHTSCGRQRRPRRPTPDPYRPEYSVVLSVSPEMRARYPDSPLSLDEALQRRTRQHPSVPSAGNPAGSAGNQPQAARTGGLAFWTELPGTPASPRRARAAVRSILTLWGLASLTPDCELLASELVANAAEHTPGQPIGLLIRQHTAEAGRPGIRCEVTDSSPQLPVSKPARPDSERGRGLTIVAALATDSGIIARPGGKTAWFTLTTTEPAREAQLEREAGA